jgi:hypothetical protein
MKWLGKQNLLVSVDQSSRFCGGMPRFLNWSWIRLMLSTTYTYPSCCIIRRGRYVSGIYVMVDRLCYWMVVDMLWIDRAGHGDYTIVRGPSMR